MWGSRLGTAAVETIAELARGHGLGEFVISGFLMMEIVLFFPVGLVGARRVSRVNVRIR